MYLEAIAKAKKRDSAVLFELVLTASRGDEESVEDARDYWKN